MSARAEPMRGQRSLTCGLPAPMARCEPGTPMGDAIRRLRRFSLSDETLLITGPSGVGKSRLAEACHQWSPRREGPFETVFLSAVPPNLVEGELFGWMPSAFTEAKQRRLGQVARAEGGTLFIDEIDKLPLQIQQKLLYLLETRRYRVLGDSGPEREADVRFVVATNIDLEHAVAEGKVLPDLFWRINSLNVTVPPLSQRSEEIGGWARLMALRSHRKVVADGQVTVDAEAEAVLRASAWPGNLRELDSVVKTAYLHVVGDTLESGRPYPRSVRLSASHVTQVLEARRATSSDSLESDLRRAASALLDAIDRDSADPQPPIEPARLFSSLLLDEAVRRYGVRDAFERLGMESVVRQRNHARQLRAAAEAVDAFRRWHDQNL